jgi:hypothetical protein
MAVGNRRLMKRSLIAAAGAGRGHWIKKKIGIRGKMGIGMGVRIGKGGKVAVGMGRKVAVGIGAEILDAAIEQKGPPSRFSKIILRRLTHKTG